MANQPHFQPPQRFYRPQRGDCFEHQGRLYFLGNPIGKGAFGEVYECTDEWDNELVAKLIKPSSRRYEKDKQNWEQELENLICLRHPNITFIYDAFQDGNTFYLIIERCYSTLEEFIKFIPNGELWLPYIARDLLQGVDFIHSWDYAHKDLHAGNIFLSRISNRILPHKEPIFMFKIGDLGISRLESDIDINNTVLAKWMLPPEALDSKQFGAIGKQIDIYHIGLLFLNLLLGDMPEFSRKEIVAGEPRKLAESLSSPYSAVIAKALRRHVSKRTKTALEFWKEILEVSESLP